MARIDLSAPSGQQEARDLFPYIHRVTYREQCTPNKIEQARLLEAKRYRTYSRALLDLRIMQRLGDVGRSIAPWLVRRGGP